MDGRTKTTEQGCYKKNSDGGRTISWSRTTGLKGTIKRRRKASNSQGLTKYNKTQRDVVQKETWIGASICLL